ncbi:hypothetical protein JCM6882_002124 [Rhodosporidiobolus microsporus]
MDKLPVELLPHIADFLLVYPHPGMPTRSKYTGYLFNFMQTSKRYYEALLPTLYRDVCLNSVARTKKWTRCLLAKLDEAGDKRDEWVGKYAVKKLYFHFGHLMNRKSEDAKGVRPLVPTLQRGVIAGLFDRLTLLSINECYTKPHLLARLLGPGQPARQHIKDLGLVCTFGYYSQEPIALFLFEALEYLDTEHYSQALVVDPSELARAEPQWETRITSAADRIIPSCEHTTAPGTPAQLAAAHIDYSAFLQLFRNFDVAHVFLGPSHDQIASQVFSSISSAPSPFSNLVKLSLQYMHEEEIFLIFFTPSFPTLKELILWAVEEPNFSLTPEVHAALRRSITHDPPGEIWPPEEPEYGFELPEDYNGEYDPVWTPLSEKELAKYRLKPYRGPLLDFLDLTCFGVRILPPV